MAMNTFTVFPKRSVIRSAQESQRLQMIHLATNPAVSFEGKNSGIIFEAVVYMFIDQETSHNGPR